MTDYWNDPPEAPEVPECCEQEMDVTPEGAVFCRQCGTRYFPYTRNCDPPVMPDMELVEEEPRNAGPCRHGNIGPCDQCDFLADIAYDSAREQKMRR
jgi:hypothetical protein